MRLAIAVTVLLLAVPAALLFAGEESTLAPRPPTADEVAAKVLAPAPCDAALLEKTLADATPAFLRATIAAIRERATKAAAAPAPVAIDGPKDAAPAAAPPDLPVPAPVPGTGRGVGFEVRFLDMPRDAARALLGGEPGGLKPIVRSATAPEVAELLRAVANEPTIEPVTSARLMTYDRQQATVEVLTKVAYVDDYEVKDGTATPIVQHEMEGLVVEVRPVLAADGKTIRLELSTKDRRVVTPLETSEITLPGMTSPVEVQRPEVLIAGWSKTLTVADGGHTLVGGWVTKDAAGKESVRVILMDAESFDLAAGPAPSHVGPTVTPVPDAPAPDAPLPPR